MSQSILDGYFLPTSFDASSRQLLPRVYIYVGSPIYFSLDDVPRMTITTILLAVFGALLVAAYALWDFGADRLVASFGRLVLRTITFGRVRIGSDADESTAMGVSVATLLMLFMAVLFIASRLP